MSARSRRWTMLCALTLCACPPRVPVPEVGSHEGDTPVAVPYPPQAPHPEEVPPQPHESAVWVDGYWSWSGVEYVWTKGLWVRPLPGATYAPPMTVRRRNGELLYYTPRWREPPTDSEP